VDKTTSFYFYRGEKMGKTEIHVDLGTSNTRTITITCDTVEAWTIAVDLFKALDEMINEGSE